MRDYIPELIADPVSESRRYVANATALLKQHGHLDYETQLYRDRKYVRRAGNTLWNGVLLVIDSVFHVKNPSRKHPDINDYRKAIAKRDQKLLALFNAAYEFLHVYMGYDGYPAKAACSEGIRLANQIIDRCAILWNLAV